MAEEFNCQRCGLPLAGQVVGNLCANCLLNLALEPLPDTAAGEDVTGPEVFQSFGDYEILEEIARGGMGVVYKARQTSLNRVVALKMILSGAGSPGMVERFHIEAEAAARLEHPGIVPIYETGTHRGQHYFSMRFVEGGTLTTSVGRDHFTPRLAAQLMIKVARAVHYAHQRGILHRDLKPGNILLDQQGEPLVADFGLAKILDQDSSVTRNTALLGTPSYMAPEQASGQIQQLSTAVDIFSLGAILYELLTGRPPFAGASLGETMRQVLEMEPQKLLFRNGGFDRDLETICLKCLEKNPQRRYGSAEALADELERWLTNQPIQARSATILERVWKWAQRKPMVATLVLALHLVGLAALIGILWQARRISQESSRATAAAQRANLEAQKARQESKRAEAELWNANFTEARAVRLAGGIGARVQSAALLKTLVQRPNLSETQLLDLRAEAIAQLGLVDLVHPTNWFSITSPKGVNWNSKLDRYVWDSSSNRVEVRAFPSQEILASFSGPSRATFDHATFTTDDQFLAVRFSNARGEARVWNLRTGSLVLRAAGVERIKFSPDSLTALMLTAQGIVLRAIATESQPRLLRPGQRVSRAWFSPDSKRIAVLTPASNRNVEVWDVQSGEKGRSLNLNFSVHSLSWHPDGTRLVLGGSRGRLELHSLVNEAKESSQTSPVVIMKGQLSAIQHTDFTPDGSMILSYAWDPSTMVWDAISGQPLLQVASELGAIAPAGNRLAMSHRNSAAAGSLVQRLGYRAVAWAGEPREAHGVQISPDGRLGVVSYDSTIPNAEGDCILWNFADGQELARFQGIHAVFAMDSRTLFTFERYTANRISRYDVSQEALANPSQEWRKGSVFYQARPDENINTGIMAPDGRTLVVAGTSKVLFLDTLGHDPPRSWSKAAYGIVASNDGQWIVTSMQHQPSAMHAASSGKSYFYVTNGSIRISPDSCSMAAVDREGIRIYDLRVQPFAQRYPTLKVDAATLEFSPHGRWFAVVHDRVYVRLYETSSGRHLATFSPARLASIIGSRALTFSPDAQWLLAAKHDGETVAWNVPLLRQEIARFGLDWKESP